MEDRHKNEVYAYWLNSVPGVGNKSIAKLLEQFGTPEQVYNECVHSRKDDNWQQNALTGKQASVMKEFTLKWNPEERYEKLLKSKTDFLSWGNPRYPIRLRQIPDAPYGLFLRGRLPEDEILAVAVIGARECSEYGRYVAQEMGDLLGREGICLISGMARGIDGISQKAALNAGGFSCAVLGCGVDICYPASNKNLYQCLEEQGGILSLYSPGTLPQAGFFPSRNRIVSGMADAVVVVEARQKSGTLITVDMALEQGREVFAVPGRLTDRLSDGCNKLLKQGAGVVLSPEDFIMELAELFPLKKRIVSQKPGILSHTSIAAAKKDWSDGLKQQFSSKELAVMACLDLTPRSAEEIRSGMSWKLTFPETQRILTRLCLLGQIEQISGRYIRKNMS